MDIDFQLDTSVLESAIAARIAREIDTGTRWIRGIISIPLSFTDRNTLVPVVVHHVETVGVRIRRAGPWALIGPNYGFGAPVQTFTVSNPAPGFVPSSIPTTSTVDYRPVVAVATLILHVARESVMERRNYGPLDDALIPIYVRVALTVQLTTSTTGATLSFVLAGTGFGVNDGLYLDSTQLLIPTEVLDRIRDLVATLPQVPINAGGLVGMLGPDARVWNAGVTVEEEGAVTIRLQVDQPTIWFPLVAAPWHDAWRHFLTGSVENRLAGRQWALHIPHELLGRAVSRKLRAIIAEHDQLTLDSMDATWSANGGTGVLTNTARVNVHNGCVTWNVDLHANITLTSRFSLVPRTNEHTGEEETVLRTTIEIGYGPDAGELFLCALGNAFIVGILGLALGSFGGDDGAIVGAIVGFVIGLISTLIFGDVYSIDLDLDSRPEVTPVEGTTNQFYVEQALPPISASELGTVVLGAMIATAHGLSIGGTIDVRPFYPSRLELEEPTGFHFGVIAPCTPDNMGVRADFVGTNVGRGRLRVTYAEVLPPTPFQYTGPGTQLVVPPLTDVFPARTHFTISEWMTLAVSRTMVSIHNQPYGRFRILIQTTGGARIVTIPGIGPTLTPENLETTQRLHDIMCLGRQTSGVFPPDRRKPTLPGAVSWIVRGKGFRARSGVRIKSTRTFALHADARGFLGTRWWEFADNASDQIEIEMTPSPDGPAERAEVALARAEYARVSRLPLAGKYRSHAFGNIDGKRTLQVVTTSGADIFDVGDISRPIRVHSVRRCGFDGGLLRSDVQILWGADGLWELAPSREPRQLIAKPIRDAVLHRDKLVVLDDAEVLVLGTDAQPATAIAHQHGVRLHATHAGVLVEMPSQAAKCDFTQRCLHDGCEVPVIDSARWSGRIAALLAPDARSIELHSLVHWHAS